MSDDTNTKTPALIELEAQERARDREVVREERRSLQTIGTTSLDAGAPRSAFMPATMAEAMQFARIMANSRMLPVHFRGNEGDCMAVLLQANRWGMDPFAVALKTYFVKDGAPPAFEAQLVNAVVNASGVLSGRLRVEFTGQGESLRCTVTGYLKADPNDVKTKTQSIARITTRNSPLWKSDVEQQLAYYTTRAWARLWCPEVLLGVYTPDELEIEPERARVVSQPMPRRGDPVAALGDGKTIDRIDAYLDAEEQRDEREAARRDAGADDDGVIAAKAPDEGVRDDGGAQTVDKAPAAGDGEPVETQSQLDNRIAEGVEAQIAAAKDVATLNGIAQALPSELSDEAHGYLMRAVTAAIEALPVVKDKPKADKPKADPKPKADAPAADAPPADGKSDVYRQTVAKIAAATVPLDAITIRSSLTTLAGLSEAEVEEIHGIATAKVAELRAAKS